MLINDQIMYLKLPLILTFILVATMTFGQNVKDTTKSKGINSTNVTGNNNHVVGGSGNSVGVNGDINVNTEKKLADNYLLAIGTYVDNLIKDKNFDGNNIIVLTESYCNYPGVTQQIIDYLKNKDYKATEGFATTAPAINEVKIDTSQRHTGYQLNKTVSKKVITIYVGRFKR
jgi:hypothetical protein